MKDKKVLNIKGTILDNLSFVNFIEKTSASHEIKKYSNINTYRKTKSKLFVYRKNI